MIRHTGRFRGVSPRRDVMLGGAVFALAVLPAARAWAGVEYVTTTSNCSTHIAGSGNALTVMAGPSMRFEVWGNSVDLTNPSTGFTFSGPSGMTASIVTRHSGADNSGRGCGFVGSAVVQMSTPSDADRQRLGVRVVQDAARRPVDALDDDRGATGAVAGDLDDEWIAAAEHHALHRQDGVDQHDQPGHQARDPASAGRGAGSDDVHEQRDRAAGASGSDANADVATAIKYNVTGLPLVRERGSKPGDGVAVRGAAADLHVQRERDPGVDGGEQQHDHDRESDRDEPVDDAHSAGLADRGSGLLAGGVGESDELRTPATRSTSPCDCRRRRAGQVITWRMTQAACFKQALPEAPYSASAPFQFFRFPQNATSAIIRVLSVNGGGCTNKLAPTTHIFEAWTGDSRTDPQVTAVTTGATYTRTTISLLSP